MRLRLVSVIIGCLLVAAIILSQVGYDSTRPKASSMPLPPITAPAARLADLGLHSTVASLVWINSAIDILWVSNTNHKFLDELDFVNGVDPKLSTPYAFTVLVLPGVHGYPNRVQKALEVGRRGIIDAAPDWRIPFYTATTYYIDAKDRENAVKYFDIAARTPDAPYYIQRFSENFGIAKRDRDKTKEIWRAIYETAKDDDTRVRAKAYIERLDIFDFLEQATTLYRKKVNRFPKDVSELVSSGILSAIPSDPFGFTLKVDPITGEAGIVTTD